MSGGMYIKPGVSAEDFIANLASASFQLAFKCNQEGKVSFVELELGLWEKLREVMRENMYYHKYRSPCLDIIPGTKERLEQPMFMTE